MAGGLPVHVHGSFALSTNRRDLWSSGGEMTGGARVRAAWNAVLLADVVAPT
jgi:hypothetical protein